MEPLRGGKLAKIDNGSAAKLKALRPDEDVPAWAFRFLQTLPEVVTILSGMSNLEQLQDNIRTFETNKPLTEQELETLKGIADEMMQEFKLPCTACQYCTSHCPQGLDIPYLLELYNQYRSTTRDFLAPMALSALPEDKKPGACIDCGNCEAVCPQQIIISDAMEDFATKLAG
jgi:hypothetical protein